MVAAQTEGRQRTVGGLCCADEQKSSPGPDRHGGKATKGEVSSSAMKTRNLVDTMRASQSRARCPGMG